MGYILSTKLIYCLLPHRFLFFPHSTPPLFPPRRILLRLRDAFLLEHSAMMPFENEENGKVCFRGDGFIWISGIYFDYLMGLQRPLFPAINLPICPALWFSN